MSGKHGRRRADQSAAPTEPVTRLPAAPRHAAGPAHGGDVGVASAPTLVAERPVPPSSSAEAITPGARGSRRVAREERRDRLRKRAAIGGAGVVVLALIASAVIAGSGSSGKKAKSGVAAGRTQTTVLVQLGSGLQATDSALVAHDPAAHAGVVVLVPSQVMASVPGFGDMPFGQALSLGDPQASTSALSDLMGVTVDGSWVLSPQAFGAIVDRVGGVSVDVDRDITKPGPGGTTVIVVPAGNQKLSGTQAVAFASFLGSGESEPSRLVRFDAVLGQLVAALPKQQSAITQLISGLGAGSKSSLAVTKLAGVLSGLAADDAANSTLDEVLPVTPLDTGSDEHAFSLDRTKTAQLVQTNLADSVPAYAKATGNRVIVQNQVGTPGVGESTRTKLQRGGYRYIDGHNAAGMPNATAPSVVLIFGTTAADIARGNSVAKALGLPTSDVRVSQETITLADVEVIVGADYKP